MQDSGQEYEGTPVIDDAMDVYFQQASKRIDFKGDSCKEKDKK